MAKKITDPQFDVGYVLPEGVVNDFNLFYKPQTAPQNPAVQDLITSLSNIVPTLATYDIIDEVRAKESSEAKAVEDYNLNRKAFGTLVKTKQIPAGASPHYYNKMMELDLATKARDFQKKFDNYYVENNLLDSVGKDGFKSEYETQLKDFYKMNGLDRYDPIALNKAFFSTTSKYRDDKERTHNNNRLQRIEKQTQDLAIKNYAGALIDLQMQEASIEEVHNLFKQETKDYIDLTGSARTANELLLSGIKTYVDAVNTPGGFDFAKKVIDSLSTLKLSNDTGYFAGSKRVNIFQKDLQNKLLTNEISYFKQLNDLNKVRKDRSHSNLENQYYSARQSNANFSVIDFINSKIDDSEFAEDTFSPEEKDHILKFHNSINNSTAITRSSPDAILELDELDRTNPYIVRERAQQLMANGELNQADYLRFANSAGRHTVLNDVYFLQSREYQTLKTFFDSKTLAQIPNLETEIPLLRLDFEDSLIKYYEKLKNSDLTPDDIQEKLNGEVRLLLAQSLQNSLIFMDNQDLLQQLLTRYRIPLRNGTNSN